MDEDTYKKASEHSEMSLGTKIEGTAREDEIRVAIAGLGNCASALVMGMEFYKDIKGDDAFIKGLMNPSIGGYTYKNIKIVAAFDINKLKRF